MSVYDWNLAAGAPLCVFSDSFYRTVREAIFQQLTPETTTEQFEAAFESLTRLRDELVQNLYPMHYGSLVGRHRCVDHLYREAVARLRSLEIMQPVPVPPPVPPARRQPPRSPDEVVNDIASLADEIKRPGNTFLGEERTDDTAPGDNR
jgi:hypothetical protein